MKNLFNSPKLNKPFNIVKYFPSVVQPFKTKVYCNLTTIDNKHEYDIIAKGDSGATKNYITPNHQHILSNLKKKKKHSSRTTK